MIAPRGVGSIFPGRYSYPPISSAPCHKDINNLLALISFSREFRRVPGGPPCLKGHVSHPQVQVFRLGASATQGSSDLPLAAGDIVEAKPAGRKKERSVAKTGIGRARQSSKKASSGDTASSQASSTSAGSLSVPDNVSTSQKPEDGTKTSLSSAKSPSTGGMATGKSVSKSARARTSTAPVRVVSNGLEESRDSGSPSPSLGRDANQLRGDEKGKAQKVAGYKVGESNEVSQRTVTSLPTGESQQGNLQRGEAGGHSRNGSVKPRASKRARSADTDGIGSEEGEGELLGSGSEEVISTGKDDNEDEQKAGEEEDEGPEQKPGEEEDEVPERLTTVRMIRLPGGRLVDPRLVKGWVVLPDGRRVVCGRCGGRSTLMSSQGLDDCPTCLPFREGDVKRRGPLTPEHRQKISAANKGRKRRPLGEAHKEKISRGMQEVYASGEQQARIAASVAGRPKTCTVCGQPGHNRATCPQLKAQAGADMAVAAPKKAVQERDRGGETSVVAPRAMADGRSSRFKGVSWSKENGKWRAQCWTGSKVHLIGFFAEEEEAARAFDVYVLEARGLNTQINFHPADYGIEVKAPELPAPASEESERPADREEEGRSPAERVQAAGPSSRRAYPLPMRREELVRESIAAIRRAWLDGVRRQRVVFLLPQDGRVFEASGWPGGIRQQFAGARGLVEAVLVDLKRLPELQGPLSAEWVDEADCVGAWQSSSLAAVLFPTSYVLPQLRQIDAAEGGRRLTLAINPQWQIDGQIVSDFGFGRARQEAEKFVGSFTDVCVMERLRVNGDEVRLYKAYPGPWQVHFMWPNGKGHLLAGTEEERPCYDRILELLRAVPGSRASQSWLDRISTSLRPPSHLLRDAVPQTQNPPLGPPSPSDQSPSPSSLLSPNPMLLDLPPAPAARDAASDLQDSKQDLTGFKAGFDCGTPRMPSESLPGAQDSHSGDVAISGGLLVGEEGGGVSGLGGEEGRDAGLVLVGEGERETETEAEDHWSTDRVEERVAQRRKSGDRARDVDIVTGLPVRDIKMEPVLQMARWQKAIFGSLDQD